MCSCWLVLLLVLCFTCEGIRCSDVSVTEQDTSDEIRVLDKILTRPKKETQILARPVRNSSSPVEVQFGISLSQILEFDEKNQVLSVLLWKTYQWEDAFLKWDDTQFGGVHKVRIPSDSVWTPDIILYNNIDTKSVEDHNERIVLQSDGMLLWVPQIVYRSSCQVDMRNYPFDQQKCTFKFGSWSYSAKELKLKVYDGYVLKHEDPNYRNAIDMTGYIPNIEWEVINTSVVQNRLTYPCCPGDVYEDLTFSIILERHSEFHTKVVLLPTIMLSVMVLLIFWIPPTRPDRTGLGMGLFSAFMLLLILESQSTPPSSNVKLGSYYCVNIVAITLATMLSIVSVNFAHNTGRMPPCIEEVFVNKLAVSMCLRPPQTKQVNFCDQGTSSKHMLEDERNPSKNNVPASEKWKILALVFDRVMFIIFTVLLVLFVIFLFPRPF